jgi:actin-like ATPase involved in cell morphogenesis
VGWVLGVDLGTTFTAAASWRDGHAEILSLGTRTAAIPSVVLFREDGSTMFGDAAELRSVTEPERVAREFKRRVGDTTPLMVGGSVRSPESVMAVLLRAVVDASIQLEGSRPDRIAVTHPASWGEYKLDVLRQAIRLAELGVETVLVPEPVAAAVHYATMQRVELHDFVAVYDLGGGTFDAAVVRRTAEGFDLYGQPEGIERLGGIDVDAAVFSHVQTALGLQLDTLDRDDPAVMSAFARLRADCVAAKEALSSDTDAVIPVMLPGLATEVRITRSELETMIRPAIRDTIAALRRAITSGGLVPEHVARILLVGGSSRIPLVGEMVNADLGRPIALDTHPKHAVALGAAITAAPEPAPVTAALPVTASLPLPLPPPPPAPLPPPLLATPPPLQPPPTGTTPARRGLSPALLAAIIVGVLALGGVGYAATRSGSSSTATTTTSETSSSSSDSTSTSTSDSSSSSVGALTDDDANFAADHLVFTLFSFAPDDVDSVQSSTQELTTGLLRDQVSADNSSFVSSVQTNQTFSLVTVGDITVRSNDGFTAAVLVKVQVDIEDLEGNSSSELRDMALLVILQNINGEFLGAEIVDCSDGSSSSALGFPELGSDASC